MHRCARRLGGQRRGQQAAPAAPHRVALKARQLQQRRLLQQRLPAVGSQQQRHNSARSAWADALQGCGAAPPCALLSPRRLAGAQHVWKLLPPPSKPPPPGPVPGRLAQLEHVPLRQLKLQQDAPRAQAVCSGCRPARSGRWRAGTEAQSTRLGVRQVLQGCDIVPEQSGWCCALPPAGPQGW